MVSDASVNCWGKWKSVNGDDLWMSACYPWWLGWQGIVFNCSLHATRQAGYFRASLCAKSLHVKLFWFCLSPILWLFFGLNPSTVISAKADMVLRVRAWHRAHRLMLLPVLKCCLLNQPSNCSQRGSTALVLNACPVTCKIGLKRVVCPRISDPRPRHAFPETGCAINIRTIESFINNTLVTDTMTNQTWKELVTIRNSGFCNC